MAEPVPGDDEVRRALAEDRATDDITTRLLGDAARATAYGSFVAEDRLVVAGLAVAAHAFRLLASETTLDVRVPEGAWAEPGVVLGTVTGPAGALLGGERTALNVLQHLSGIATATRRAVDAVAGTGARITHTRKTLPGLRALERLAVLLGGGVGNRTSLAEQVYWKDNHWALLAATGRTLAEVLRDVPPGMVVWVEVDDDRQFAEALAAGVTHMLADNQTPERVAEWVQRAGGRVTVQASGGITPDTAAAWARAGAQLVSIGALTHSAAAAPIGFTISPGP